MDETIMSAIRAVIDRVTALSFEDRELRLRLRAVALEYLRATEEQSAVTQHGGAAEPAVAGVADPSSVAAPSGADAETPSITDLTVVDVQPAAIVAPARPAVVGALPRVIREETPAAPFAAATDDELPLLEDRCRVKADGARWAATRRSRLEAGADYYTEIEPLDREIIERARSLPDCFLWMNNPMTAPQPADVAEWGDVAGCFATVASGVGLIRSMLDAHNDGEEFEQALELLAEAQSALKTAIERIGGPTEKDQVRVYLWLKSAAFNRQFYMARHMRADDPADPGRWPDLDERIGKLDASIQERRQGERQKQSIFNRIRYHLKLIPRHDRDELLHDWKKVVTAVEELIQGGTPPSNRELRELLMPAIEQMPEMGELPPGVKLVLREIDRFLAARPPASGAEALAEPTAEVRELANLIRGKVMILIGGDRRPYAQQALESQFELKQLDWIATAEHESIAPFEAHIARPEAAVVLLAIRWSSHAYGDVRQFCEKHGKPLVRLPAGYNPNQVAIQVLAQCGERLRGGLIGPAAK